MHPTDVPNPTEHNQWYPFLDRPLPAEVDGVMHNTAVIPLSDVSPVPSAARFVVVGAGIHGMSTAYHLAMELEKIALEDEYFVARKLYPNIDFYSGITLRALGFPRTMFTVLFALARTVGWIAQWKEMIGDPSQRIGRPRQLYTGPTQREYVQIDRR